jgi:hypothetical protein
MSDINGIVTGTITSPGGLSTPAQSLTTFYGSYTGGLSQVSANSTTYTYSKGHNTEYLGHYIRFTFNTSGLYQIQLARDGDIYTEGVPLVDSSIEVVDIQPEVFTDTYPNGIDIVVNNKMVFFFAPMSSRTANGQAIGVVDLGHSGVTRDNDLSMLMGFQKLSTVLNDNSATAVPMFYTANTGSIPYSYNYDTLSYGSIGTGIMTTGSNRKVKTNGDLIVIENPVYSVSTRHGFACQLMFGVYKIPTGTFSGIQTYQNADGLYRLTYSDFSFLVD